MTVTIELIAVGNELLEGDVQDTNTHWLCQQLTGMGGRVVRAVMVEDDNESIARELRGALDRGAELVITTGGLGPTADDHTLEGVAQALFRTVREDPRALAMIRERYAELARLRHVRAFELTAARRKMACLPEGSEPVPNPVGTAPAALIRLPGAVVVCLPGVPEEMKGIFRQSLVPFWRGVFQNGAYHQITVVTESGDESTLAPHVAETARRHPRVYVKSRARRFGSDVRLHITLSARGRDRAEAEALTQAAWEDLARELKDFGPIVKER